MAIVAALSLPALGMSNGPGAYNSNDELTVKYGCSCHNNGAPSDRAVVMVTGVPLMYLSLIHISEPTRRYAISYAVFCLKKKK